MQILSYDQISTAVETGQVHLGGFIYKMSVALQVYVSKHMPKIGSSIVGRDAILVATPNHIHGGEIVMFLPNGPPDPGAVAQK